MATAGQSSCAGDVSTAQERLVDKSMTKVLKHDIRDQCFTPASLHSHVCGIDRKNIRPTLAEVAGIAVTSTKHVKGANVRRYVTKQDDTGFWIGRGSARGGAMRRMRKREVTMMILSVHR